MPRMRLGVKFFRRNWCNFAHGYHELQEAVPYNVIEQLFRVIGAEAASGVDMPRAVLYAVEKVLGSNFLDTEKGSVLRCNECHND